MAIPDRLDSHRCEIGECPVWHPNEDRLYWTDIGNEQLLRYSPSLEKVEVVLKNTLVGGFTIQKDGSLLLFMEDGGVGHYSDGNLTRNIFNLSGVMSRFNDVTTDAKGRVLCGTMPSDDSSGQLYRLDQDGTFECLLSRVQVPNGMGFSPDSKRLYFAETDNNLVHEFDYEVETGTISGRNTFLDLREGCGKPDGLTVDTEGKVWVAQWGKGTVDCYHPDGILARRLGLPASNVTSLTFGPTESKILYVTTAQAETGPPDQGGNLFSFEVNTTGQPIMFSKIDF